jgi:hypothetical protein
MNQLHPSSIQHRATHMQVKAPLFILGRIVSTPGALSVFEENEEASMQRCLLNHQFGEWGELCPEDKESNDDAVKQGGRILSSYLIGHQKVWIIIEADRSATTILLPSEY